MGRDQNVDSVCVCVCLSLCLSVSLSLCLSVSLSLCLSALGEELTWNQRAIVSKSAATGRTATGDREESDPPEALRVVIKQIRGFQGVRRRLARIGDPQRGPDFAREDESTRTVKSI